MRRWCPLFALTMATLLAGCRADQGRAAAGAPLDSLAARMRAWDAEARQSWGLDHYRPVDRVLGWSPAGRLVYFHQEQYGKADVGEHTCGGSGVYESDGHSAPRPVITGMEWCRHDVAQVQLAADGRTLVGAREPDRNEIMAADLETRRWRTLARFSDANADRPVLAPDGRSVAVVLRCSYQFSASGERTRPVGCRDERQGLYVVSLPDGARTRVGSARDRVLRWLPDGRALLVADSGGVARIAVPSGERTKLSISGSDVPSPDGRWVARVVDAPDSASPAALRVAAADRSREWVVFRNPLRTTFSTGWGSTVEGEPFDVWWAPDARTLVFSRGYRTGVTLWRVNLDGSGLAQAAPRLDPAS